MDALKQVLAKMASFDLSGKINTDDNTIRTFGAHYEIFCGMSTVHGIKVAIRRMRIVLQKEELFAKLQRLANELKIWSKLAHPNILPLLGFYIGSEGVPSFISQWMELGSARDYILVINQQFNTLSLARDISKGLCYLHSMEVVHGDMKLVRISLHRSERRNLTEKSRKDVLISSDGRAVVADFGISHLVSSSTKLFTTAVTPDAKGTDRWMAKELFAFDGDNSLVVKITKATDVWAFGMTVYELLTKEVPFYQYRNSAMVVLAIMRDELPLQGRTCDSNIDQHISSFLWSVCRRCWNHDAPKRPMMETLEFELAQTAQSDEVATASPLKTSTAPSSRLSDGIADIRSGTDALSGGWDQFATHAHLFGVTSQPDEITLTSKLDQSGEDFKEWEKRAERIAEDIINAGLSNPRIAGERLMNATEDNSGGNGYGEYNAIVRGHDVYVPPGARPRSSVTVTASAAHATSAAPPVAYGTADVLVSKASTGAPKGSERIASRTAASPDNSATERSPADLPAFRDWVKSERQRLDERKRALVKNDMQKRMPDLVSFSQSFKLNRPIPEDVVPILAKDEDKQNQIRDETNQDAQYSQARAIGFLSSVEAVQSKTAPSSTLPAAEEASGPSRRKNGRSRRRAKNRANAEGAGTSG